MDEECIKKDRVMLPREQNCSHQAMHFAEERTVIWFYYKIEVRLFFSFFFIFNPPPAPRKLYVFVRFFFYNKYIFFLKTAVLKRIQIQTVKQLRFPAGECMLALHFLHVWEQRSR